MDEALSGLAGVCVNGKVEVQDRVYPRRAIEVQEGLSGGVPYQGTHKGCPYRRRIHQGTHKGTHKGCPYRRGIHLGTHKGTHKGCPYRRVQTFPACAWNWGRWDCARSSVRQQDRFQAGALSQLGESRCDGQAGKEEEHQEGSTAPQEEYE